ncbi:hypothetical protein QOK74_08310 [Staphylococcus saprophyticus]|uniref:hypothetical protein n=1 Tax=Staphylococcus saprophyticus TaxID=29385 RepID=UPI0024C388E4|nr:hypothetical protein [Staphylococcus saprophyticus]MDK1672874.1 hypothetical protein [Staphylococcus saprophyticus]
MTNTNIQTKLKTYINKYTNKDQNLEVETIQEITESLINFEDKKVMENMSDKEFSDFLECDVNINIFNTNQEFLKWYYEDENSAYNLIEDLANYKNIDDLVKSLLNDYTYQFKNGLIINLMF